MLRFGKKHDQSYNDKLSRSNRGRARTSATVKENRRHVNRGYRLGQEQLVEIRARKKHYRLVAQLAIEEELFDLELSRCDPEIWLHGTDLTTFRDTVTPRHRGYPSERVVDPFTYVLDDYDWESGLSDYQDDEGQGLYDPHDADPDWWAYRPERARAFDWDWDTGPASPETVDAAWRDLWVDGRVHDPEDRDQPDSGHGRWSDSYCDPDYDDYDYLAELKNPLVEREDAAPPATIEASTERANERRRAGERYFKQTGRTVGATP